MTHAHTHALDHGSPALWIGLGLLLVAGLLFADRRRAWPRSVFGLALLVAVFGFESAVHSVHHLSDPTAADSCTFLSGSKHVDTASPALPDAGDPLWTATHAIPVDGNLEPPLRSVRTHEGRAPPSLSAV
jgi:hypothetical protein